MNTFWKIYFWVLAITLSLYHYGMGFHRIWEILDFLVDSIFVLAVFGFCWEKAIFKKIFWKCFLPVFILWVAISSCFIPELPNLSEIKLPNGMKTFDLFFSLTITILGFIVLYLYGYRSFDLWESDQ
jgi:hypothetical protein